jgi:hypothetical protein
MKMGAMVLHYGLRNIEPRNNVIELEKRNDGVVIRNGRKCLDPFSEVVHGTMM